MSDFLQNPLVKQIAKTLNLPLPIPALLVRNGEAFQDTENAHKKTAWMGAHDLDKSIQQHMQHRCQFTTEYESELNAVVLSGVGIATVEDTTAFFKEAQRVVPRLSKNGRVIVLSQTDNSKPESYAVQRALEGFSRALSKELGKNGTTVNHLRAMNAGAENIARAILFFMSDKSSFITGQVLEMDSAKMTQAASYTGLLQGKVAIVTGGARGIGAAAARVLHREGARVVIVDVPQASEDAQQLANELEGDSLLLDITHADAPQQIRDYILKNHQRLDILVNNAGITRDKTLAKMSEAQWNAVMQVNLKASIRLTEALIENGFSENAKVVGLASISGIAGNVGQTNYSASKAGMIAYMNVLSRVYPNLFANAVAPGFIETKMTEGLPLFVKEGGRRLSTLKQGGLPEDVAELIGFLCSPLSDGINGQVVRVCGGSMIGA